MALFLFTHSSCLPPRNRNYGPVLVIFDSSGDLRSHRKDLRGQWGFFWQGLHSVEHLEK